jgi:hypothetical protein
LLKTNPKIKVGTALSLTERLLILNLRKITATAMLHLTVITAKRLNLTKMNTFRSRRKIGSLR